MINLTIGAMGLACLAAACAQAGESASVSSASEAAAPQSAETILLQLADRLMGEAERQHEVNNRMDDAVERFQAIIVDLDSNELLKQGHGPALDRVRQILKILATKNVPDAARYLEEARKQLAALSPNLSAADREIDIILQELQKILSAGSGEAEDLLRELEILIQDEKRTQKDTKDWGAQLLQSPETAAKAGREIAANQDRITRRTERFMDRLATARDAQTDPARNMAMRKAYDVMESGHVPRLMNGAARDIDDKKPVSAAKAQEDAIRAMLEAALLLRGDDLADNLQAMKELRDRLDKILKQETDLREKTEKVAPEKFHEEKNDLQVQQRAIDKELQAAAANVPKDVSQPVKSHMADADKHMQSAEKEMAAAKQSPAVESEKKAENSLKEAIKALDDDIAKAEQQWQAQNQPAANLANIAQQAMELAQKQLDLKAETAQTPQTAVPQLAPAQQNLTQQAQALAQQAPMPQFKQAVQAMQEASKSLEKSQQQQATGEQQKAADALMAGAQALQQAMQAMNLAAQQQSLMNQTGQTPQGQLPQLAPAQQSLQKQAETGQFKEAAKEMQKAAQSLEQSQQSPAMQSQQAAIDSLMGQAAQAMGMQPGQMPAQAMAPGTMPGQMPAQAMPNVPNVDPMDIGSREFGRGGAGGPASPRGDDHWNVLGQRERDALYQRYIRQLPPEYRELLGDYFEALSKESARTPRPYGPSGRSGAAATEVKP
jgi:hypothetical protein